MKNQTQPTLFQGFKGILIRDILLTYKRPGDLLNPIFFFVMVSTLFPLALDPSPEKLAGIAPGVIWVAALLSSLLPINSLFLNDLEDGSLDQLLLSPQPLPLLMLGKTLAHWLVSGFPLTLICPVIAITYNLEINTISIMVLTLIMGTMSLSLLSSVASAITIGLKRNNILVSLLILPLAMPILIFGSQTVSLAQTNNPTTAGLYFLMAYLIITLSFAPFATASAVKIGNE